MGILKPTSLPSTFRIIAPAVFLTVLLAGPALANEKARESQRFSEVASAKYVTDDLTKLHWYVGGASGWVRRERQGNWLDATDDCAKLGNGWRLPTVDELATLMDAAQKSPVPGAPAFSANYYWTSSRKGEEGAMLFNLKDGKGYTESAFFTSAFRCVRSAGASSEKPAIASASRPPAQRAGCRTLMGEIVQKLGPNEYEIAFIADVEPIRYQTAILVAAKRTFTRAGRFYPMSAKITGTREVALTNGFSKTLPVWTECPPRD